MATKHATKQAGTRRRRAARDQTYLEVVGTGERIPVPDDPAGERAAVAASPALQRMAMVALVEEVEGKTIPFDELRRKLDAEEAAEAAETPKPRRGRPPKGNFQGRFIVRVPTSVHRDLVERAAREHTMLNQLVLSYISRGLGQDEGRAGAVQ